MEKRLNFELDWSKHVFTQQRAEDAKTYIYQLKIPDSIMKRVRFTITDGVTLVTGDYGRWTFCREFHPRYGGRVSDGYWLEKLSIGSKQQYQEYDAGLTVEALEKRKKEYMEQSKEEDADFDPDTDEGVNWYDDCISMADTNEGRYTSWAYDNLPPYFEDESIPIERRIDTWILIIFEAFEEMCRRMPKPNKPEE
jgi:hypothetical protein